jgi:hypothetical protein
VATGSKRRLNGQQAIDGQGWLRRGINLGVKAGRRYLEVLSGAVGIAEGGRKMAVVRPDSGGARKEQGADRWGPHVSDRKGIKRFGETA